MVKDQITRKVDCSKRSLRESSKERGKEEKSKKEEDENDWRKKRPREKIQKGILQGKWITQEDH